MLFPKIHCERNIFNPQLIAKLLHNISTNNYGFTYIDDDATIYFCDSQLNLLCRDVSYQSNGYSIFPITYSTEWVLIHKLLNQLDKTTKLNMIDILKSYSSKLLLIIDVIMLLPLDHDIKYIIMMNVFTNLSIQRYYTLINDRVVPFCVELCKTCHYLVKFSMQENIIKRLMNYFMIRNADKNIMCTFESITAFILCNEHISIDFTILIFDHNTDEMS